MEIWYIDLRKSLEIIRNATIANLFKKVGYNLDIMRQTACIVLT